MKIKIGYFKDGNCWKFKPSLNKYWSDKLWWFSFWRFYCVLDFRKCWLDDMVVSND